MTKVTETLTLQIHHFMNHDMAYHPKSFLPAFKESLVDLPRWFGNGFGYNLDAVDPDDYYEDDYEAL